MTNKEAFNQLYGSNPGMRAVLEQRRAIARETKAALERLQHKMHQQFPPVDSVGSQLDLMFRMDITSLEYRLTEIERVLHDSEAVRSVPSPSSEAKSARRVRNATSKRR